MKICFIDDADPESQKFPYVPEKYLGNHTWEKHYVTKGDSVIKIKNLVSKGFDVFINLCCGAFDENSPGIEIVDALERFDQAFTGADKVFYEPTREAMKMVCEANGLAFPKGIQVKNRTEATNAAKYLNFPLLVKHSNSYASVGLTPQSRVTNVEELLIQVDRMNGMFGSCLIEEFIEGTEYSVLVAENPKDYNDPIAYTPIEIVFAGGEIFKHESLKWVDYSKISVKPVEDPVLYEKLTNMAKIVFCQLHGTSYGRCDIRCDKNGTPYLLEINPNGAVFYPKEDPGTADYILNLEEGAHERFMEGLLQSALVQREKRRKGWEIRYFPTSGFGVYASKDYREGEEVLSFEDLPHRLISTASIEKLNEDEKQRVYATSFHLSYDLFYAPATNPEDWRPVNHSCNPSLWFQPQSLKLISRKSIKRGEELSVDYGMLFTDELPSFSCLCKQKNCRKMITGTDYQLPQCQSYDTHRSPFILDIIGGRYIQTEQFNELIKIEGGTEKVSLPALE